MHQDMRPLLLTAQIEHLRTHGSLAAARLIHTPDCPPKQGKDMSEDRLKSGWHEASRPTEAYYGIGKFTILIAAAWGV